MHFFCLYWFSKIYILRGSVATQLRCGGIFNSLVIANCPQSVPVKEFLKLVNIWERYVQKFSGTFFMVYSVFNEIVFYSSPATFLT